MVYITQSTTGNVLICTITEKQTLTSPYYLLRLVCEQSGVETSCLVTDVSTHTIRYNDFRVTEKTSPVNLSGEVRLVSTGRYRYYIYEQTSASNLDYTLATTLLEQGFCEVIGTTTSTTTYSGATTTKTVYNG